MTSLKAGTATHVGQVRSNNQDSKLVVAGQTLFGVADGMGGHQGGEVASAMAVELVEEHATDRTMESLVESVRIANRAIFEKAGSDRDLHGMGTTLVAIKVVDGEDGDEIAWVNVGDSRVYLLRDDRLLQLSHDHSLVEDLVRDGQLTRDEAAVHPQRNILTRALGIDIDVDVDSDTVLPFNGDRFLLCSDGLFNEVSEDQMASVLRRLADPAEAADELVRLANEGGGRDNITVVVVDVEDDGGRAEKASAILAEREATRIQSVTPEPATVPAEPDGDDDPFRGRVSSLPDAGDDFGHDTDDLYAKMGSARSRRFTWRVLAFFLALLVVGGVVVGAIAWSARNTYHVAFDDDLVAVYRGKPGGVLWFDPTHVRTTAIERDEVPPAIREDIQEGKEFGSESEANRYLVNLRSQIDVDRTASTTTTAPTTTAPSTTTAPATTTTTAQP